MRLAVIASALLITALPTTVLCQKRAAKPAANSMSEMPEILVAPLFIEDAGFTSTISMVSELNFPVAAQVVLFDRHGAQIASQTVAFPAHSHETVRVGDLLRLANSSETIGSVEVLPDPAKVVTMAIAAQLSIDGSGASFGQHIEEEFLMAGTSGSGALRAAGGSLVGNPVVSLRNTATTPQSATVSCITENGAATAQTVQLAAGGWATLQACTNSTGTLSSMGSVLATPAQTAADSGAFGVSVSGSGQPGSLAAFGFSWHGAARGAMLSSQNFVDAGTFRSSNTVFPGVPVGAANYLPGALFTPQLMLANFGSKPANVTVQFARTSDSGPEASRVAGVSVGPMSVQTVALPDLTGDPQMRNSFIVQSDAPPGAVIASLAAVGAPGFGLVEQIGKDQSTQANGGGHPWDLTGGQDAVLLLFNHSTIPKYFNVKIGNGGVLWQQPYQLAAMETRTISVRELVSGQVKDQDGKVLPQNLEQGEVGWFNANPAEGKGRLMQIDAAAQTVAANGRVARNFSCGYYYVLCGAYLYTDAIALGYAESSSPAYLGEVIPMICTNGDDGGCSGQESSHSGLGYTYSWVSNSPNIATVYGSSTSSTAMFWGNGAGTGSAVGYVASGSCQYGGGGTPTVTPTVSVTAGPTAILAWHANSSKLGQCVNITASSNPPSGGTFSWQTTSNKITLANAETATVQVCSVADQWSLAAGDTPVTVTYTLNKVSSEPATTTITILKPNGLSLVSSTVTQNSHTCTTATGYKQCPISAYQDTGTYSYTSYIRTLVSNIADQLTGAAIGLTMVVAESYTCTNVIIGGGNIAQISDCYIYCSSKCRQGQSDSDGPCTQTITANGFTVGTKTVNWTCSDATVQ